MLSLYLGELFGTGLFGYLSFRAVMAGATAFVLALALGRPAIGWLKRHRVSERVEKSAAPALAEHAQRMGKASTPTMGGSFLVLALLVSVLCWCRLDNIHVVLGVLLTAGLAAVGFVDDFRKLTQPRSKGLSERSKLLGQSLVVAGVLAALVWYARTTGRETLVTVFPPFFKEARWSLGLGLAWCALWACFAWLILVGTSNAANITDGLDGLAAGCMLISGLALSVFCYVTGRADWTLYLNLPHVPDAAEMCVVGAALCGSCMGFLWYNAFPAKVFMGDSGSLPIGGLLAWMALVSKQELVLPLLGLVFFLELGSSALQRVWYRRSGGRRLFTMAPVHHGLQLSGGVFRAGAAPWHEATIVIRAWILAATCAIASLALMKVR